MERRAFFRSLFSEAVHFREGMQGKPQFRLSEIKNLPDEKVSRIMPMILENYEVIVDESEIRIYDHKGEKTIQTFPLEPAGVLTLRMFDGATPLGEISRQLADKMGWQEEQGYEYAKALFLTLVDLIVCVPSNPID